MLIKSISTLWGLKYLLRGFTNGMRKLYTLHAMTSDMKIHKFKKIIYFQRSAYEMNNTVQHC